MSKNNHLLVMLLVLVMSLSGCGGGGSSTDSGAGSNTGGGGTAQPFGPSAGQPDPRDLSDPVLAAEAIKNISDIEVIDTSWAIGEWASYWVNAGDMIESKLVLSPNQTFTQEKVVIGRERSVSTSNGSWFIFRIPNVDRLYYVYYGYQPDGGGLDFHPIEREGENGLRFVYQGTSAIHSTLYKKLDSSADVIYPGMSMLGTHKYIDYSSNPGNPTKYLYTFDKDGTLNRVARTILDEPLFEDTGTWRLDTSGVHLTLDGVEKDFTVAAISHIRTSLTTEGGLQYWSRLTGPRKDSLLDPFVGEFQTDKNQYLSIEKKGNGYRAELSESLEDTTYLDTPAQVQVDGQLKITLPPQGGRENNLLISPEYNRLVVTDRSGTVFLQSLGGYPEKASNKPVLDNSNNELGGWRTRLLSGGQAYYKFYDDGSYTSNNKITFKYGNYSVNNGNIVLDPVCGAPEISNYHRANHRLKLGGDYYNPIPGFKDLGFVGTELKNILQEYFFDTRRKGVGLKPHPNYADVFVFSEETTFSEIFRKYRLKPDGTGTFYVGSGMFYDLPYLMPPGPPMPDVSDFIQSITYYIAIDGDKETLVFYGKGDWVASNLLGVASYGSIIGDPSAYQVRDIYHGRTALCEPGVGGHEFVLPIKNE